MNAVIIMYLSPLILLFLYKNRYKYTKKSEIGALICIFLRKTEISTEKYFFKKLLHNGKKLLPLQPLLRKQRSFDITKSGSVLVLRK
jgi:hypothetical protein